MSFVQHPIPTPTSAPTKNTNRPQRPARASNRGTAFFEGGKGTV